MFRKDITVNSSKKIVDAVKALANAGDPAAAEAMRRWFNKTYRGYKIIAIMDGKRIEGYRLESERFGVEIREVAVKCPGAAKRAALTATDPQPQMTASADPELANRLQACFED